jgi:beta-lactamase class A
VKNLSVLLTTLSLLATVAIAPLQAQPAPNPDSLTDLVSVGTQPADLQQQINQLKTWFPSLSGYEVSVYLLNLSDNSFVDIAGDRAFSAASIIKLPILMAFLQDVDAGKISLNETLTMKADDVVGGSGYMQDMPVGSRFSALEVISNMIITSDNTATNMAIDRMGGIQVLNERFAIWGLKQTRIREWLPDLQGTNTVTAKELTRVMLLLRQGKLLSPQSQQIAIDIMQRVRNRSLLAAGLGQGCTIAHKTGDIGFLLGDSGMVTLSDGKQYMITALVYSSYDDDAARDYIQAVSRTAFQYFNRQQTATTVTPPPGWPSLLKQRKS